LLRGKTQHFALRGAAASARDNNMDEATKHGYGVLLLRQGLPKSQFYANVVRRLNARQSRPPAPGITPHLPFATLGKASNAPSINAAERDRRLQALHDAARRPARGRDTGIDGRDAATQQLYERLVHILDGPVADGVKETKALRADAGKNAASAKEASASLERAVEAAADRVAARVDAVAAAVAELRPDVKAVKAEVKALGPYAAGQKPCPPWSWRCNGLQEGDAGFLTLQKSAKTVLTSPNEVGARRYAVAAASGDGASSKQLQQDVAGPAREPTAGFRRHVNIPRRRVAATPRPRCGDSAEAGCGDAAAVT